MQLLLGLMIGAFVGFVLAVLVIGGSRNDN